MEARRGARGPLEGRYRDGERLLICSFCDLVTSGRNCEEKLGEPDCTELRVLGWCVSGDHEEALCLKQLWAKGRRRSVDSRIHRGKIHRGFLVFPLSLQGQRSVGRGGTEAEDRLLDIGQRAKQQTCAEGIPFTHIVALEIKKILLQARSVR